MARQLPFRLEAAILRLRGCLRQLQIRQQDRALELFGLAARGRIRPSLETAFPEILAMNTETR